MNSPENPTTEGTTMTTEVTPEDAPLGLAEAAGIVKMREKSAEDAADVLDGLPDNHLRELASALITLVGVARTFNGGPLNAPAPSLAEWCSTVIEHHHADTPKEKPRPRRRTRNRSNRFHLREAFAAGPHGQSDPFGPLAHQYDTEDDDN